MIQRGVKTNVPRKRRIKGRGKEFRKKANERFQERIKKPIPRSVVPSFFTLMNLFSGFLAILMVFEGKLTVAAWLIVLAAFFDVLDGFMARLTNGDSVFGIELDSLSDIVSFGVAPGILIYAWLFSTPASGPANIALPLVAALPALCGAIRLARFNIDAKVEQTSFFKGLPIPAQAMMLVAFFLTFKNNLEVFEVFKHGANSIVIPVIIVLSLLMVSTVPFDKVPRFNKEYMRQNRPLVFLFIVYALTIILLQEYGLMIVFTIFILRGLIMFGFSFWDDLMGDDEEPEQA